MPEEEEEPQGEPDLEAEMLRMMQEEMEGEGGEETEDAGETAEAEPAGDADDMMAALQDVVAQTDGADDAPAENIDEMLEQEMLRAMSEESAAPAPTAAVTPYASQVPALADSVEGIDRLSDVEVTVTVELGGNHIPIREIMTWGQDSTVELEPLENDPVEVFVNGKPFARGEIVVVGDTFGVRILQMIDQPDEPAL